MRLRSRFVPAILAGLSVLAAAGCPSSAGPSAGPKPTPTASAWRPLPKAVPMAAGDVPCVSADDCAKGLVCSTPEERAFSACGAPSKADCGPGWIGSPCGGCFLSCASYENCPKGMVCGGGGYCVSQSRCMAPPAPLP